MRPQAFTHAALFGTPAGEHQVQVAAALCLQRAGAEEGVHQQVRSLLVGQAPGVEDVDLAREHALVTLGRAERRRVHAAVPAHHPLGGDAELAQPFVRGGTGREHHPAGPVEVGQGGGGHRLEVRLSGAQPGVGGQLGVVAADDGQVQDPGQQAAGHSRRPGRADVRPGRSDRPPGSRRSPAGWGRRPRAPRSRGPRRRHDVPVATAHTPCRVSAPPRREGRQGWPSRRQATLPPPPTRSPRQGPGRSRVRRRGRERPSCSPCVERWPARARFASPPSDRAGAGVSGANRAAMRHLSRFMSLLGRPPGAAESDASMAREAGPFERGADSRLFSSQLPTWALARRSPASPVGRPRRRRDSP